MKQTGETTGYAQAIAFADWIAKEHYVKTISGKWLKIDPSGTMDTTRYTTSGLFKIFTALNSKP